MQTSSVVVTPFGRQTNGHFGHRRPFRALHWTVREWARGENLVATFSLALLVMTVLVLIYQSIAI
jgi:hypothetical protein